MYKLVTEFVKNQNEAQQEAQPEEQKVYASNDQPPTEGENPEIKKEDYKNKIENEKYNKNNNNETNDKKENNNNNENYNIIDKENIDDNIMEALCSYKNLELGIFCFAGPGKNNN